MQQRPAVPVSEDLEPYAESLRALIPSREALLAEAKAQSARQANRRRKASSTALMLVLAGWAWLADPSLGYREVQVASTGREVVQLDDGSVVELDAGSVLRIEHHLRSRQFELLDGEGLFSVVHQRSPFIVRSQGVSVRDIGTVFDVRSDLRGVQVAVLQGAVEVDNGATRQLLTANQQLLASRQALGAVEASKPGELDAWRRDLLHFDGTPLDVVVAQLQRHRDAPIRLTGADARQHRLSGQFPAGNVEQLIDSLPHLAPVTVQRENNGVVTLDVRR
ncbi:FecR family protein [Pseudomonas fontis]|uniref:FecR domain-containing protein n=1 Tax=Pseudomonas fontis TaxID=2942633 RepID=A0ABT5NM64_9PSED|nr:FecR domain-containing protein [Pseudomonas fontis]MDD0976612.1 FecR domain-containing protein [Pseudomonas fontis]MDD0988960.1 FecR domain-containing protein [Pseudomonas fontis]